MKWYWCDIAIEFNVQYSIPVGAELQMNFPIYEYCISPLKESKYLFQFIPFQVAFHHKIYDLRIRYTILL